MYLIYYSRVGWNNKQVEFDYLVETKEDAIKHINRLNNHQMELLKIAEHIDSILTNWDPIDDYRSEIEPQFVEITSNLSEIEKEAYREWNRYLDFDYFMDKNNIWWDLEDRLRENLISQYPYQDELKSMMTFDYEIADGVKKYNYKELEVKC